MEKSCIACGKNYQTFYENQKFCSSKCRDKARVKNKQTIVCLFCGQKKNVIPSLAAITKYCGRNCFHLAMEIPIVQVDGKSYKKCSREDCEKAGQMLLLTDFGFRGKKELNIRDTWCKACKNRLKKAHIRTPHGRFLAAQATAKRRKIPWDISEKDYIALAFQFCIYCGDTTGHVSVGLDRKNSQLGYTIENVVTSCGACNCVRGDDYIPFDVMLKEIAPIIRRIKS